MKLTFYLTRHNHHAIDSQRWYKSQASKPAYSFPPGSTAKTYPSSSSPSIVPWRPIALGLRGRVGRLQIKESYAWTRRVTRTGNSRWGGMLTTSREGSRKEWRQRQEPYKVRPCKSDHASVVNVSTQLPFEGKGGLWFADRCLVSTVTQFLSLGFVFSFWLHFLPSVFVFAALLT